MRQCILLLLTVTAFSLRLNHYKQTVYYFQNSFEDLSAIRSAQLYRHNTLRVKHGSPPLRMNDELNEGAQAFAQKIISSLVLVHSQQGVGGQFGESLYYADAPLYSNIQSNWDYYDNKYDMVPLASYAATDKWYSEYQNYDYEWGLSKNGLTIGHFSALVWKNCKEVGFGYGWRKNPTNHNNYLLVVVARYRPLPNIRESYTDNVLEPKGP